MNPTRLRNHTTAELLTRYAREGCTVEICAALAAKVEALQDKIEALKELAAEHNDA